jgi:hypothetical protein
MLLVARFVPNIAGAYVFTSGDRESTTGSEENNQFRLPLRDDSAGVAESFPANPSIADELRAYQCRPCAAGRAMCASAALVSMNPGAAGIDPDAARARLFRAYLFLLGSVEFFVIIQAYNLIKINYTCDR